jgi:hypothetical protein
MEARGGKRRISVKTPFQGFEPVIPAMDITFSAPV